MARLGLMAAFILVVTVGISCNIHWETPPLPCATCFRLIWSFDLSSSLSYVILVDNKDFLSPCIIITLISQPETDILAFIICIIALSLIPLAIMPFTMVIVITCPRYLFFSWPIRWAVGDRWRINILLNKLTCNLKRHLEGEFHITCHLLSWASGKANSPLHVPNMGISRSRYHADGTINSV